MQIKPRDFRSTVCNGISGLRYLRRRVLSSRRDNLRVISLRNLRRYLRRRRSGRRSRQIIVSREELRAIFSWDTHRVAISNHRLVSFADGKVTFRWRDSTHSNEQKLMT
jgi:Putative transposase